VCSNGMPSLSASDNGVARPLSDALLLEPGRAGVSPGFRTGGIHRTGAGAWERLIHLAAVTNGPGNQWKRLLSVGFKAVTLSRTKRRRPVPNAFSNAQNPSQPIDATLPSWTDAQAITSYITTGAGVFLGFFGSLNPTWGTAPKWLAPAAALAGFVIATGAQIFNFVSHRSVNKAAITAHGAIHAAAINASNGTPANAAQLAAVALQRPVMLITPSPLPNATAGQPYSQTLTFVGGTPPISWAFTNNNDHGSLKLDASTGVLSGTAADMVAGPDLAITVSATDSNKPPRSVQQVVQLHTA